MADIHEKIKAFSDEFLLAQYLNNRSEYTPEAVACMEQEITARTLDADRLKTDTSGNTSAETDDISRYREEEFVPFNHGFYQTDLLLAGEMLREAKVPFTLDTSMSSNTIPIESEGTRYYTIHVPKSLLEKARACVDQHFDARDGHYFVKFTTMAERLKAFNFHELSIPTKELSEEIEVQFSEQEAEAISALLLTCENEADTIEQESGRMLFYYDNLRDCHDHVSDTNRTHFSCSDLLTILETMQVFCDKENYPRSLDPTAEILLDFFKK
jgi:hypothetical protein